MKIVYTNAPDDMAMWQYYHLQQTSGVQWRAIWPYAAVGLGAGLFCVLFFGNNDLTSYLAGGVMVLLVFGYLQVTAKKRLWKSLRRYAREVADETFCIEHELEITEDALVSRSHRGMYSVYLRCISGVGRMEGYTFIYASRASALVLPERGVTEGDYAEFVAELEARCAAARDLDVVKGA